MPISAEQRRAIGPALDALETIRQKHKNEHQRRMNTFYAVLSMGLVVGAGIVFYIATGQVVPIPFWIAAGIAVVGMIWSGVRARSAVNAFHSEFKGQSYHQVVSSLSPSMTYRAQNMIGRSAFMASKLFSGPDRYNGDDYFIGTTKNGCTVEFSELHAEQEHTHTDEDGHTTTSYSTIFKGLFFVLHLPNVVHRDIRVLPDSAERGLGKIGKFLQKSIGSFFRSGKMIYFEEHPAFEKEFVVYSTNEEAARQALTLDVLQDIYDLRYKWRHQVHLSFIDDKIYLALSMPSADNLFQAKLNQPVDQQEFLQDMIHDIQRCLTMVDHLSNWHPNGPSSSDNPFHNPSSEIPGRGISYKKSSSNNNPFLL